MSKRQTLVPYTLKLEGEMWSQIDRNRLSMVGVLHPQGITKVDYIRNALDAYNQYFEEQVMPRVKVVTEEIDLPLPVFIENGVDVIW
jgi:hypothetical protein